MKFTFEANMYKGECYRCPMAQEREIGYMCAIDDCFVTAIEDPSECPLKESNVVEWHPYPEKKPPRSGVYLVTPKSGIVCSIPFVEEQGWPVTVGIKAWAELPAPYKEISDDN